MGKAKPVTLGNGKNWPTQKTATAYFTAMLARYSDGQRVNAADADDLAALLVRYDRCLPAGVPTKIGPGISHFTRELNLGQGYATSGFHVHRIDNTSVDFSFWEAVRLEPPA